METNIGKIRLLEQELPRAIVEFMYAHGCTYPGAEEDPLANPRVPS